MNELERLNAKMEALEERVAFLDKLISAHIQLSALLFGLLIRKDLQFQAEVAEVLRQFLVSPAVEASPELQMFVRSMRDSLVLPIPEGIAEAARQPSIRPVE